MLWKSIKTGITILMGVAVVGINTGCYDAVAGPPTDTDKTEGPGDLRRFDLTRDGRIDISDVVYFAWATKADITGDERVDERDVARIGLYMGQTYPEVLDGLTASEFARAVQVMSADLNGDHEVNAGDLAMFGMLQPMAERADVNGDSLVNDEDLAAVKSRLGQEIEPS